MDPTDQPRRNLTGGSTAEKKKKKQKEKKEKERKRKKEEAHASSAALLTKREVSLVFSLIPLSSHTTHPPHPPLPFPPGRHRGGSPSNLQ